VEGIPKRVTWRTGAWIRQTIRELVEMDFEFVTAETIVREKRK